VLCQDGNRYAHRADFAPTPVGVLVFAGRRDIMGRVTMVLQGPDSTVRIEVLGEELRRPREACGLALSQVVSRIGISESHLSRMEMEGQ
jgi:hypothetical protein